MGNMDDNKVERKSFLFYESFRDVAHKLPENERLDFYEMLIEFGLTGEEPKNIKDPLIDMAFTVIGPVIKANIRNYVNGCKGGAPRGNKNAKKQPKNNRKTTQKQGNENENVNVNDNDNDNDNSHSTNTSYSTNDIPPVGPTTLEELEASGVIKKRKRGFYT